MNQTRSFLILALCFVAYLLFNQWMSDYHQPPAAPAPAATVAAAGSAGVPDASAPADTTTVDDATAATTAGHGKLITVTTDVLRLDIDTRGGTVVGADLLKYPQRLDSDRSVRLLDNTSTHFYEAQSGLIGVDGNPAPNHKSPFRAEKDAYTLAPGQDRVDVRLEWTDPSGVTVTKVYTLKRGSYDIGVEQQISNHGKATWHGQAYRQLERIEPPEGDYGNFLQRYSDQSRYSFFGAAWYGPDKKFNKIKFDDFKDHPLASDGKRGREVTGGWLAMEQAYFVGAWLPPENETNTFSTLALDKGGTPHYLIRGIGPVLNVAPGASNSSTARLYLGPKVPDELKKVSPSFDLALNYGAMTVVARPLHWILSQLHGITGNWGWAIILLVLLINGACYKLYAMQYRSSAHMRRLKPRMDALKERYGDDKQKLQQATMELYKKEKVNPAAGCLPLLITIPIFFGLYELLRESVELRQAPFIGWIQDLSAADPYFVLPVIYALVMLVQSLTMPMTPGMDGTQQKMMRFMPVAMAVIFAFFPSGLVLYYSVSALCRIAIQWWVYHQVDKQEARKKEVKA